MESDDELGNSATLRQPAVSGLDRLDRHIILVLLILASLLVLPGLGATRLWTDDAQTAVVARNILNSGLPEASDGRNLVTIFSDQRDVRDGIYIWQPWLPNYLVAASMAIVGVDSFGARLPFALAFIVLVGVSYAFFRSWLPERQKALLAVVLLLGCVPLLLHARQCRYYVLVPLFSLLAVQAYLRWFESRQAKSLILLVCWLTLLFNSFAPGVPGLVLAMGIDFIRRRADRQAIKVFCGAAGAFLIVNLPTALYCRIWDRHGMGQSGYTDLGTFGSYLLRYLLTINTYFFPLILIVLVCVWRWQAIVKRKISGNAFISLALTICVVQLVLFSLISDYPFTRYLIGLTPFLIYLGTALIWRLVGGRPAVAWLLGITILVTNLLQVLPVIPLRWTVLQDAEWTVAGVESRYLKGPYLGVSYARGEIKQIINTGLGIPLLDFVRGILAPPRGPIDSIVDYLEQEATPADTVKISYGDLPLIFHTGLKVTSSVEVGPAAPRWLIDRHFNEMIVDQEFRDRTVEVGYSLVELPVPDVQWNNRPDPIYHYFKPLADDLTPPVTIFVRND